MMPECTKRGGDCELPACRWPLCKDDSDHAELPSGDALAQEANDYANEAIASSKYTIPPGSWRALLRDMVQEAYLDGFRRVRDASETTLLDRTIQQLESEPAFTVATKAIRDAVFDVTGDKDVARRVVKKLRGDGSFINLRSPNG